MIILQRTTKCNLIVLSNIRDTPLSTGIKHIFVFNFFAFNSHRK